MSQVWRCDENTFMKILVASVCWNFAVGHVSVSCFILRISSVTDKVILESLDLNAGDLTFFLQVRRSSSKVGECPPAIV